MLGQAVAMFVVTNIDDIVVLALFFGRAGEGRRGRLRITLGQYLGFSTILVASVIGALGASLLPASFIPYLGLVPLLLGMREGWKVWREHGHSDEDGEPVEAGRGGPGVFTVAGVTFANGGDNIGVYVPVFAASSGEGVTTYCVTFLVMVGLWCAFGRFLATRPVIARALGRWGHLLYPAVLTGLGLFILVQGDAFGL